MGAAGNFDSIPYCRQIAGRDFWLKHYDAATISADIAMPYVSGALLAVFFCWLSVTLYFFRRYALSAWITPASVIILLAYKIAVIGW